MPELPGGGLSLSALNRAHRWTWGFCQPRLGFGLARLACVCGLFALLVSAISPADDSVQPDFSRRSGTCHPIVKTCKLVQTSLLFKRNCTATPTALGIHARPVIHSAERAVLDLHARVSEPGFELSHAGRAPPARCRSSA